LSKQSNMVSRLGSVRPRKNESFGSGWLALLDRERSSAMLGVLCDEVVEATSRNLHVTRRAVQRAHGYTLSHETLL